MPRETTADRRVRRATIALLWGQWLNAAMEAEGIKTFELVEKGAELGATFESGGVTHWRKGDNTAAPDQAVAIARALHRDPAEALRAAGHDTVADEVLKGRSEADEILAAMIADGRRQEASVLEEYLTRIRGARPAEESAAKARRLAKLQAKVLADVKRGEEIIAAREAGDNGNGTRNAS